jgi:hypothetical protein
MGTDSSGGFVLSKSEGWPDSIPPPQPPSESSPSAANSAPIRAAFVMLRSLLKMEDKYHEEPAFIVSLEKVNNRGDREFGSRFAMPPGSAAVFDR